MGSKASLKSMLSDEASRLKIKRLLNRIGYDTTDWVRVVMYRETRAFIRSLGPENLDVIEIAAGPQWRRIFQFKSYTETQFPDFDICTQVLDKKADLIIADQVFEHLPWPSKAGKNVFEMLRPGGHFVIATPFLVRVHNVPIDCRRWTEQGMSFLLQDCGFPAESIKTGAWGNRACLIANLKKWRRYGWYRSLKNEPNFPVMVWAIAQKPKTAEI